MEKPLDLGLEWTLDFEGGTWPLWKKALALRLELTFDWEGGTWPLWKSPWALGCSRLLIGKVRPGPCGKAPGPGAGVIFSLGRLDLAPVEKPLGLGLEWTCDLEGWTWPLWKKPLALRLE